MSKIATIVAVVFTAILAYATAEQTKISVSGVVGGNWGCMPSTFVSDNTTAHVPTDDKKLVLSDTPLGCTRNANFTYPPNSVALILRGECYFYLKVHSLSTRICVLATV